MSYSEAVLQRAKARLDQAKADRDTENAQRLQQAYEKVPQLRDLDRQLRMTMVRLAQTVFSQGGDTSSQVEQLRQENQDLQHQRQWLIDANFEEGYLDETPICKVCGGSGYVGSAMCSCLRELCRQEQRRELTILSGTGRETFAGFDLNYYSDRMDPNLGASPRDIMTLTLATCKRYAQTFTLKSGNLLLNGNPGLGKTFLSACIARSVSDSGYSVVYETAGRMFSQLEKARFSSDPEAQAESAKYTVCQLLIIDDLGAEFATPFVQSALYGIINDRMLAGLPTIASSNLQSEEFSARYGPAIASRLLGSFRQVAFVGKDIRLQMNRGI